MAAPAGNLYFCDSCADKRVREVKTELERLFTKKETDPRKCGICCSEMKVEKVPIEERIENQEESLQSDRIVKVIKTESDESVVEIPIVAKDVSVSKDNSDGDHEANKDADYIPSDVSDDDQSDAGSNYSDEIESKASKSKSTKKKGKRTEKTEGSVRMRNKLEITDLNPEFKDLILEGSITPTQFACKTCQKEFKWNGDMIVKFSVHLSEHMEQREIPKPFRCPLCTLCFSHHHTLKRHTQDHTNPRYYDCPHPDCDRKFRQKLSVRKHEELVHSGIAKERKSFVCQICDTVFEHQYSLKKHLLSHEDFKPFKCNECGKCFIDKKNLGRHQERHNDAKKAICDVCGKLFVDKRDLKIHRITHTDERIYQCEYCPYRAKRLGNLRNHIKNIHTESDPNKCKCNFCGLTFLSATACTMHERKHQYGVALAETLLKPYKCPDCGFRATKPCKIRQHQRSHTGEKPFKCVHCQKAFAFNGQCRKHMKICKKK